MPYYRRPWRRRYRRFWTWRTGRPFRRRYRRRWRRFRVRRPKRKLKTIPIREWQPSKINRLTITGKYPLFEGTNERIGNNNTQYIDATAPEFHPGGGLFSIIQFSLAGLYELHLKGRNWWTKSNCTLPLIKYLGCTLRLYRSHSSDYVSVYARCGELTANELMYNSCQPSILTLNKHKKIVTCSRDTKSRRPYKTMRIPPPSLMRNQWYFQKELANTPLLVLLTSAMSLNRWYIPASAISSTIGFTSLNTDFFKYCDFKRPAPTEGYIPNQENHLFSIPIHQSYDTAKVEQLIYLGQSKDLAIGTPLGNIVIPDETQADKKWEKQIETGLSNPGYWGNPFDPTYLSQDGPPILITTQGIPQIKTSLKANRGAVIKNLNIFAPMKVPLMWNCRYNPQNDRGHNSIYLFPITTQRLMWGPPIPTLPQSDGLPLWALFFGWLDFHYKNNRPQHLWTDYAVIIVSDYITPKHEYYVVIDQDFIQGKSSYMPQENMITQSDRENWHPKANFQKRTINKIISTGPGTVKLPDEISTEAQLHYRFHFKLGGCPPPMDDVCNPQTQPTFPRPGNILQPTLLQNPATPIQYYLSSFDQRRHMLTETAAKRIKKDWETKETIFPSTGSTAMDIQLEAPQSSSTEDSSEEEESTETIQLNLQRHRRQQRKLTDRILQLLKQAQKLQ
nr:MAG: ORF1 [TTV-like mini virus]